MATFYHTYPAFTLRFMITSFTMFCRNLSYVECCMDYFHSCGRRLRKACATSYTTTELAHVKTCKTLDVFANRWLTQAIISFSVKWMINKCQTQQSTRDTRATHHLLHWHFNRAEYTQKNVSLHGARACLKSVTYAVLTLHCADRVICAVPFHQHQYPSNCPPVPTSPHKPRVLTSKGEGGNDVLPSEARLQVEELGYTRLLLIEPIKHPSNKATLLYTGTIDWV